jgi:hypothetical protein
LSHADDDVTLDLTDAGEFEVSAGRDSGPMKEILVCAAGSHAPDKGFHSVPTLSIISLDAEPMAVSVTARALLASTRSRSGALSRVFAVGRDLSCAGHDQSPPFWWRSSFASP